MDIDNHEDAASDEISVTHKGRWKKTVGPQADRSRFCDADLLPAGFEHSSAVYLLPHHVSASAALRQQHHYIFLSRHLPDEMLSQGYPKPFVSKNWLLNFHNYVPKSPVLMASVSAFFAARVGRLNGDDDLIHKSRGMYISSLEHLQLALNNPVTRLEDETLAAVEAVSFYELFEAPGVIPSTYLAHQQGALKLLELRGPKASTTSLGHSLFLDLRTQVVSLHLSYYLWPSHTK
jgi:hypothetical protein